MAGPGFRVDTARWRNAAAGFERARGLADEAREAASSPSVPASAFGVSGPGSRLAEAVRELVGQRVEALAARAERLGQHASNLTRAADEYDHTEARQQENVVAAAGEQEGERS